jgi:hypothetical protein
MTQHRRNPPARWTLPDVVKPAKHICFQVPVPNDRHHVAAFLGAIYELAWQNSWQRDPAHTAKAVAAVWLDIFNNLKLCDDCATTGMAGADGDELMIRQNPANPCELQTSIDGVTWCTFADLSKCVPAPQQPGDGAPQPPGDGGQVCYHAEMQASGMYLVPTPVNTGDVLEIQNAMGAGNDGTVSPWHCPNGDTFFAGGCVGGTGGLSGGDPAAAVNHMRLIVNIGGTYYDGMAGPITVPGGVSAVQPVIQVNDSAIGDNAGSYRFDVCVTNNGVVGWSHEFDFSTGAHGWFIANGNGSFGAGKFICHPYDGTANSGVIQVEYCPNISTHITRVVFEYTVNDSQGGTDVRTWGTCPLSGAAIHDYVDSDAAHSAYTNRIVDLTADSPATLSLLFQGGAFTTSPQMDFQKCTLYGVGPEPTW